MSQHVKKLWKLALPLGLLALVLIYAAGISDVRSQLDEGFVGTRFLPKGLVMVALACLAAILLREWRGTSTPHAADDIGDHDTAEEPQALAYKPYALFVAILAYVGLFKPMGFVLTTAALCLAIMWLFDYENGRPLRRLLGTVVITGLAYLLFAVAFGTRLDLWPGML